MNTILKRCCETIKQACNSGVFGQAAYTTNGYSVRNELIRLVNS